MMLYASLGTMTVTAVHGKRGTSSNAAEARKPRIWLVCKPDRIASRIEWMTLIVVRVYIPQLALQAARRRV